MSKKLALIAILATSLALPATGALARGGGGGHMGGGHMGGGHMGGGHMGGGFGSHIGGRAGGAFAAAPGFHGRGIHGNHRRFIGGGFGGYDSSCWNWQSTPLGGACRYPDYY